MTANTPALPPTDSLLECLVFLTAHYGRAKSAVSIAAGLPYDGKTMRPEVFVEAAQRLGFKAQIVKRKSLDTLSAALFPVIVILKEAHNETGAVVLLNPSEIYNPKTGKTEKKNPRDLNKDYAGFVILARPAPAFLHMDLQDKKHHWFWALVWDNRHTYFMVLLGAVFINLFGLVSPIFIMNVYDRVIPNNAIETGWALGIGAFIVFVFDLALRLFRGYLIDLAGRRIDVMATRRIYDHMLDMKLSHRPKSSGSFANMLRDFDSVRDFFTSATVTGLVDLPFTLFFLFIMYSLGGAVAFIPVALLLLVFVTGLALQVPLKSVVRRASKSAEAKHGLLVETIHGLETIKALAADGHFRARYGALVGENAALGQGSRFISGLGVNIATFLQQISAIIIVLTGMYMVQAGMLTVGGLIACVMLGGRALSPMGAIAGLMTRYHQAGSALKTLDGLMARPVDRPADKQFLHRPSLKGAIAFEKVSFSYPDVSRHVLHDVSFSIAAGEKVGIIGRVGSGKSTMARLMMGLYEPESGTILIDGTDMRQIDPADVRRNFALIAQDSLLFNGSVRDNIVAALPQAFEADILEAAKGAGVHDFIARHPLGYDAPVGEHGGALSGGQRQAIALARAMLVKPAVLICDEPTNAMDLQAEMAFKAYIQNEIKDKTFILITHKHAMLDMVDRLIVVDHGRIVMDGPRAKVVEALQGNKG